MNVGSLARLVNVKGELFSSTFTYGVTALIRLTSSLILTRLLSPEAYGTFGILLSITFIIELLSDVGSTGLLVRHARGREKTFIHTVWTVRLIRSLINFGLLYGFAPLIADIYNAPTLTHAIRVFSFWFIFHGLESMAFVLAQRDQKSRIGNNAEMFASAAMTISVIALAFVLKDHFAFIYGMLISRAVMMVASHFYYRDIGVAIAFDREAVIDQFRFARFVLPSSLLTIVLAQYDKIIFLKLFDLALLGVYGVAGGMAGPIAALISKNSRVVLYARCAEYARSDRATVAFRYYSENERLLWLGVLLPAAVAGFSESIVSILYDARYAGAGMMLMVLALGGMLGAVQNASENLLVAVGRTHVVLVANIVRLFTILPGTLLGYFLFGFPGFLWFGLAASIPVTAYYFIEQRRQGLLDLRAELRRVGWALALFGACFVVSRLFLHFVPPGLLANALHRH